MFEVDAQPAVISAVTSLPWLFVVYRGWQTYIRMINYEPTRISWDVMGCHKVLVRVAHLILQANQQINTQVSLPLPLVSGDMVIENLRDEKSSIQNICFRWVGSTTAYLSTPKP